MSGRWPSLRRAFASYGDTGFTTRAFVAARFVVAPLGPLEEEVLVLRGKVLSLGSGLCMLERYLADRNPDITIEGVDLDERKVGLIGETHARSPRVELRLGDATSLDGIGPYAAVLVCDALHHFGPETHESLAVDIARVLQPGGTCIVKELDKNPRWKFEWNRFHDRMVAGPEPIYCRTPQDMASILERAGLVIERCERTDHRLTPYAHYILRARKPL